MTEFSEKGGSRPDEPDWWPRIAVLVPLKKSRVFQDFKLWHDTVSLWHTILAVMWKPYYSEANQNFIQPTIRKQLYWSWQMIMVSQSKFMTDYEPKNGSKHEPSLNILIRLSTMLPMNKMFNMVFRLVC